MNLIEALKMRKNRHLIQNYGREILRSWASNLIKKDKDATVRILDIGCSDGQDLINISGELRKRYSSLDLYGLDFSPASFSAAVANDFKISVLDIERDAWPDWGAFDLIVINQVLEHTKEIFKIIRQTNVRLVDGGLLFIGVPNLAAWHNRLLLLFGRQPACIRIFSGHIRGFTKKEFIDFMEKYGGFKCLKFSGANVYPFPPVISRLLSRFFPTLATTNFFAFKKIGSENIAMAERAGFETKYQF